jgi:hypothetical protein
MVGIEEQVAFLFSFCTVRQDLGFLSPINQPTNYWSARILQRCCPAAVYTDEVFL